MRPDVVIRPRDRLDLDEARRLVGAIEGMPGLRVHVDVSAAREVHPTGLAFLAYSLEAGGRVTLGGLTRRHERLIGYLLGELQARAATARSTSSATEASTADGR